MEMMHHDSKSGGVTLSPKASFILGLVGGVLVLCTLGFFILLSIVVKGGGLSMGSARVANNDTYVPSPSAPVDAGGGDVVGEVPPISDEEYIRGDKNAEVSLIEYSDFECPFCERFHPSMLQLMNDPAYKGKVKWVYRHYPLSFHPQATPAANAAECAGEQGKFWEYADGLFAGQAQLGDAFYGTLADQLKLNRKKFDDCYSSRKYQAKVTSDQTSGTTAGVTGTPGTIIIGADGSKQLVPGAVPYEQLKAMVDAAL